MGASTFMQVATVANALGWPLAAGAAVVAWSRMRAAAHARRLAAAESRLQGLYQTLEARPVPSRLTQVVDALEEAEELGTGAASRKRETPARS